MIKDKWLPIVIFGAMVALLVWLQCVSPQSAVGRFFGNCILFSLD